MFVDKDAKDELNRIKNQWQKNILQIGDRELSPSDVERIYASFDGNIAHYRLRYQGSTSDEISHEEETLFVELRTDLHLAIQKGKQNYRKVEHERKMASIKAYGNLAKNLGINIAVLVVGVIGAVVGQKIL